MNILQSIPLPPPLLNLICSNQKIKKLRCLNLKAVKLENTDIPSEILRLSIFSSINSKEIVLNETELDEYFKITQAAKPKATPEALNKLKETSISLYHLFENKNKYATSFVIIRKYQLELLFPLTIKDIFLAESSSSLSFALAESESKFIDGLLFDYEFLLSMKVIFPSKEEIKTIITQMSNMNTKDISSMAFIDKLYYTIAQFPELNDFINGVISLIEMKNDLEEVTQSLTNITSLFESIINDKLKFIIGIMLKINNYLNKSTGGKELKGFDLVSLENVLDLKINSKYFFNIVGNYYITKYPQEALFNKTELGFFNFSLGYLSNAENEFRKESSVKKYEDLIKGIEGIVNNPHIKESLHKEFTGHIKELIEKADLMQMKEIELKSKLKEYFLVEPNTIKEELNAYLIKLFKVILKIEGKLTGYLGIKNKNSSICDNKNAKMEYQSHQGYSLTETEGIQIKCHQSKQYIDSNTYNKENIFIDNEDDNKEKRFYSNANNKSELNMNQFQFNQLNKNSLTRQGAQAKDSFTISSTFLRKYCL